MKRLYLWILAAAAAAGMTACSALPWQTTFGETYAESQAESLNEMAPEMTEPVQLDSQQAQIGWYYGNFSYEAPAKDFSMQWDVSLNLYEDGTFRVLNADRQSRGHGTYALQDGRYVMNYEDGHVSEFIVQQDGNIQITGELYYGKSAIPFDAVGTMVLMYQGSDMPAAVDDGTPQPQNDAVLSEGTYSGTCHKVLAAVDEEVDYVYTAVLEDGKFSYSVTYSLVGSEREGAQMEGTFTLENGIFVLDTGTAQYEGAATANDTLVISLPAAENDGESCEVTLTLNTEQ